MLAIAFALGRMRTVLKANASRGWPTTRGRVESCRPDRGAAADRNDTPSYRVAIRYSYAPSLTGTRIFYGDDIWTQSAAEADRLAAAYPPGSTLQVHFDPDDPGQAVLQPGIHRGTMIGLLVSLVATVMVSWLFVGLQ